MQQEKEIKLSLSKETQARIFPKVTDDSIDQVLERLKALFEFAGFRLTDERPVRNIDEYYDTPDRELAGCNSQLRVRRTAGGYELTVKKPLERHMGTFTRSEFERAISADEYDRLRRINFQPVIEEHFVELIKKEIRHAAVVDNERIQVMLDRDAERYKLAIDSVQVTHPSSSERSARRMEIEIEAASAEAVERLDDLKIHLCKIYPEFEYSNKTKYEAALEYIDRPSGPHVTAESLGDELSVVRSERDREARTASLMKGLLAATIGVSALLLLPLLLRSKWLDEHPNRLGLYGCALIIIFALSWAIAHRRARKQALGVVGFGALLVLLQILGK